jgi:uncharacterized protein YkwD
MTSTVSRLLALACALGVCAAPVAGAAGSASASDQLLAPTRFCPDPASSAPARVQVSAMLCYHAYARRRLGLAPLRLSGALDRSAGLKTRWIIACRAFSHTACGRSFTSAFSAVDYLYGDWVVGENLAWGSGFPGTVRNTFDRWLHSPEHREDIIRPDWRDIGMAFVHVVRLFGFPDVTVWAVHFGRH